MATNNPQEQSVLLSKSVSATSSYNNTTGSKDLNIELITYLQDVDPLKQADDPKSKLRYHSRPRRCNGSEPLTKVILLLFFIFSKW